MGSMFGSWGYMGQVAGQPAPASPPNPGGGFPGIFPGAGISNSGWAGFGQFHALMPPCTPENIKSGKCVMGPPSVMLGKSR